MIWPRLETIRLHHLIDIPVILPTNRSGVRQLLNVGLMRRNINLAAMLETDSQGVHTELSTK